MMMDEKTLREFYDNGISAKTSEIQHRKHVGRAFVVAELTSFAIAAGLFVLYVSDINDAWYVSYASAASLLFYIAAMQMDKRNSRKIEHLEALRDVYAKEIKYLEKDYSGFDDGERYADPDHPFAFDMDIFGRESLFNRISRAVTTGGSDLLARHLGSLPATAADVERMREAQKEIAADEAWRTQFLAIGERVGQQVKKNKPLIDSSQIEKTLLFVNDLKISDIAARSASLIIVIAVQLCFAITIMLSVFSDLPSVVPTTLGVMIFFSILLFTGKTLGKVSKAVNVLHKQLGAFISLVQHINSKKFETEYNAAISARLFADGENCLSSFRELSKILDGLDRRGNILGLLIFNILYASDYFLLRRFLKWKKANLSLIAKWAGAVSEIDALASMASYRFNNALLPDADIEDAPCVKYSARDIYHPFLGTSAIKNDFDIEDENYYIITGANMAGKSTFLRTLGINYILAMNGMPVSASSLKASVFNLFTSMRTTDDLTHGISYFNAELLRLKQLIANCKKAGHTLIILDEILKGTNSLDKLNGSRLFLQEISRLPVSGVIATHDLELSKLEDERFHNYCFEISLSNEITYTYKITKGVAKNQNATYLLQNIIREI